MTTGATLPERFTESPALMLDWFSETLLSTVARTNVSPISKASASGLDPEAVHRLACVCEEYGIFLEAESEP